MHLEKNGLRVDVTASGPDHAATQEATRALFEHPSVQEFLNGSHYRLLKFDLIDSDRKVLTPRPPRLYRATIFDYTHNRTIFVDGSMDALDILVASESSAQPLPSVDEFGAAVDILMRDPAIGPELREQRWQPYRPMPPVIQQTFPDGRVERTVAVGLLSSKNRHKIVGVNMARELLSYHVYDVAAPSGDPCWPSGINGFSSPALPDRANIVVTHGSSVLWSLTAIRPSASSGTNGSGIELRHVNYKGKQVLHCAHLPIVNVQYLEPGTLEGCGPTSREWQHVETRFQAVGTDVATGFRLCRQPPRTDIDPGAASWSFNGLALSIEGSEVVLVSALKAGVCRYINEWRLHADGTIRPRFGVMPEDRSTVRTAHHHAYWRFDFDIRTAENNRVEEFNNPPILSSFHWQSRTSETKRLRDASRKRKWRVVNSVTGEGYEVIPGQRDGTADSYGSGDVWILRYRGNEIDDGQGFTTDSATSKAQLDKYVDHEPIENQDVVFWYGAHVTCNGHSGTTGAGPDLRPVNW